MLSTSSGDPLADRRADYAEMLFADGEHAAAAGLMTDALELAPGWALGWFRLGEFHEAAGESAAAAEAWRMALRLDPADHAGATLKLALAGGAPAPDRPPSAFVETLFDQYAERFDTALVGRLDYRAPELLEAAIRAALSDDVTPTPYPSPQGGGGRLPPRSQRAEVARTSARGSDSPSSLRGGVRGGGSDFDKSNRASPESQIGNPPPFRLARDLGCGTGLMGERLRPLCARLEGFDISAAMLAKAKTKDCYDLLGKEDLQAPSPALFAPPADLVTAADVFMYLGRLDGVIAAAARMLAPGGLFAFSVETLEDGGDFQLTDTRRYRHGEAYLRRMLEAERFDLVSLDAATIRMDRSAPVNGLVVVARRAG